MTKPLRDRRQALGVTQHRLAELAGCSRSMIQLLEAGYAPAASPTRDRVELVLEELSK